MKNPLVSLLTFLALLFSAGSFAAPGHYIVVTMDDSGKATPVFYRAVNFSDERLISNIRMKSTLHDADHLFVSGTNWFDIAEVPRFIRGEFAANGVDGDITAYQVEQQERSFALRIPSKAGSHIKLEYMGVQSELNVLNVAAKASKLSLANVEIKPPSKAFVNSANRVDILVFGDGYTSAEQALFNTDAENLRVSMFNYSPYMQYANMVNWTTTFTASAQSGADHPPYQAGCTSSSCCADTAAQSDPKAANGGIFVNTAYDGKFCTSQIHRLVTINSSKIYAAAAAFPDWDQLIVLMNDSVYGGSGGSIAVTTTNVNAKLIVIHEYGHTFHDLADEYTSPYPGYPACSDISPSNTCEVNVTNQTTASLVKWKPWFTPGNSIPTPAGTAGIGLFEGARYQTNGVYRPANSCGMRSLGAQFCSICSQAYVLKLYRGGWGTPANGIDLIEPGTEVPITIGNVSYNVASTVNFSATVLRPTPDTVTLQWYLDGQAVNGATSSNFNFQQLTATPVTRSLELRATDNSTLVKAEMAGTDMVHSRTWTIQVIPPPSLSINDVSVAEGNAGVVPAIFTINLSSPAPVGGVRFDVATGILNANGNSALAGKDYSAWQQLGKTIAQGQSSTTFSVKVMGDKITEPDEVFAVRLSNPIGASISDGTGVGIITNDDRSYLLGSRNNSDAMGASGSTTGGSSLTECQRLQKEVANLEAKIANRRLKEAEGVRNILRLESMRSQLSCQH
ncbi:MAG: M64 family metallopeptidase [Arenimonas sp.]